MSEAAVRELWTPEIMKMMIPDKAEREQHLAEMKKIASRKRANCIKDLPARVNPNCLRAFYRWGVQKVATLTLRDVAAKAEREYYPQEDAYNKGFFDAPEAHIRSLKADMEKKVKAWKAAEKKFDALHYAAMEEGYNPNANNQPGTICTD